MSVELEYFPQHDLLLIRVNGDITIEEYARLGPQTIAILRQATATTNVMIDLRALRHFPTSLKELRKYAVIAHDPTLGWIVVLTGERQTLKFIVTVLLQLQVRGAKMRVFDTLEETINFFKGLQPNAREYLNWLDDLYKSIQ